MTQVLRKRKGKFVGIFNESENTRKYRNLFRELCSGKRCTVCTVSQVEHDKIFGNYVSVFSIYIDRGLLEVKTIDELGDDEHFYEFDLG